MDVEEKSKGVKSELLVSVKKAKGFEVECGRHSCINKVL